MNLDFIVTQIDCCGSKARVVIYILPFTGQFPGRMDPAAWRGLIKQWGRQVTYGSQSDRLVSGRIHRVSAN